MKVRCRFDVTYECVLEVSSPEDIGDELANVSIAESEECKYVSDSFEPQTDEKGGVLYEVVE